MEVAIVIDVRDIDVVVPNFKRRLSGVTSTIIQLVPAQLKDGTRIAVIGPGLPASFPTLRWRNILGFWKRPSGAAFRVWHARRNVEMLVGLIMRDVLHMPLKLLFTSAAQRRHSAYTRLLIRQMDEVVATSTRSGSYLQVPHTVISHGVDLELFHPPRTEDDDLLAASLPGRHLVGCFGRVRYQKGTDLFVRAIVELFPRYPDWTAVVCGRVTAEHREFDHTLKTMVTEAGLSERIHFLGEVEDIKPWYRRALLYVAPSRNEGFGLTPLEAMASQTTVVASDAGAYAEMIVPGETGEVVPAGDYEALRDAIHIYLANPHKAEAHAARALAHVTQSYALAKEVSALRHIYNRLSRPLN